MRDRFNYFICYLFIEAIGSMFDLYLGSSGSSVVKNLLANEGNVSSILGLGRSPGKGNGNLLQESCLGNQTERGTWQTTVHGVAKSWTRLSNFTFFLSIVLFGE